MKIQKLKKEKGKYSYPLQLDEEIKTPLKLSALRNSRTVNKEINHALKTYLGLIK